MKTENFIGYIAGGIFAAIGTVTLITAAVFLVLHFTAPADGGHLIVVLPMGFIGIIFSTIGYFFFITLIKQKRKKSRLMGEGTCYDAEITRVYYNRSFSYNGVNPLIIECGYSDRYGRRILVKSGNIWDVDMSSKDNLKARVWVNPDDPKDYYVEQFFDGKALENTAKYDYDYR